jgi:hypothetical protein
MFDCQIVPDGDGIASQLSVAHAFGWSSLSLDDDDDDDDDEFGYILSEPSTAQLYMIISRRNLVDCLVLERTSPNLSDATFFYQEVRVRLPTLHRITLLRWCLIRHPPRSSVL